MPLAPTLVAAPATGLDAAADAGGNEAADAGGTEAADAGLRAAAILDDGSVDVDALLARIACQQRRLGRRVRGPAC